MFINELNKPLYFVSKWKEKFPEIIKLSSKDRVKILSPTVRRNPIKFIIKNIINSKK